MIFSFHFRCFHDMRILHFSRDLGPTPLNYPPHANIFHSVMLIPLALNFNKKNIQNFIPILSKSKIHRCNQSNLSSSKQEVYIFYKPCSLSIPKISSPLPQSFTLPDPLTSHLISFLSFSLPHFSHIRFLQTSIYTSIYEITNLSATFVRSRNQKLYPSNLSDSSRAHLSYQISAGTKIRETNNFFCYLKKFDIIVNIISLLSSIILRNLSTHVRFERAYM